MTNIAALIARLNSAQAVTAEYDSRDATAPDSVYAEHNAAWTTLRAAEPVSLSDVAAKAAALAAECEIASADTAADFQIIVADLARLAGLPSGMPAAV